MTYNIVIVGAGTAGLMSAYLLAKSGQKNIVVLEKENGAGKKLKAAGNGKCNITNRCFSKEHFHSEERTSLEKVLDEFSYEAVLRLFDELGIATYEQNGYYYPLSNQGKQVVDILYKRCVGLGVQFSFQSYVTKIESVEKQYRITLTDTTGKKTITGDKLIMAAGGMAYPSLGGCDKSYYVLNRMHMKLIKCYPCLTPIYIEDNDLKLAKGVRVNGTVVITSKSGDMQKERGQIQFNENNISGICVMNLSSVYNLGWSQENPYDIYIDLLPDYREDEIQASFKQHTGDYPEEKLVDFLDCFLPDPLSQYIRKRFGDNKKITDLTEKEIGQILYLLKHFDLNGVYHPDYSKAQVTGGGVSLTEVNQDTFESRMYPNLYIVGELLDVNGDCGGYNISFAILSAKKAAEAIQNKEEDK